MDVADLLSRKGDRGRACPGVEHRHVLEQLCDKPLSVGFASAGHQHRSPGSQKAQLAVTPRARIGRDDLHAIADKVWPIVNVLGISLANDKNNRRVVRQRMMWQPLFPVVLHQAVLADQFDIAPHRQSRDVGVQAFDDRSRLIA